MEDKPKSVFERYDEMLENKKHQNIDNIVPKVIGIVGAICFLGGILSIFSELCTIVESLAIIAGAFFFFGFSVIVKAACKYLDNNLKN